MKILPSTPTRFAAPIALLALALLGVTHPAAAQQPSQAQASAIRSNCRSDYRAHCASVPTGGPEALQCLQKNVASLSPACQQAVNAVGGGAPAAPAQSAAPAAPPPPAPATPAAAAPAASATPAAPSPSAAATPTGKAQATTAPEAPAEATAPAAAAATAPAPAAPANIATSKEPSKAQAAAIQAACRADYQPHCPGVAAGPAAWSCLQANVASLSPPCQQAVNAVTGAAPAKAAAAPAASAASPAAAPAPPPVARVVTPRQVLFLLRTACGGDFRALCPGVPVGGGRVIDCLEAKAASLSPNCQAALGALGR